jgi:hypothetical protein
MAKNGLTRATGIAVRVPEPVLNGRSFYESGSLVEQLENLTAFLGRVHRQGVDDFRRDVDFKKKRPMKSLKSASEPGRAKDMGRAAFGSTIVSALRFPAQIGQGVVHHDLGGGNY